jgi:hypothetical protein
MQSRHEDSISQAGKDSVRSSVYVLSDEARVRAGVLGPAATLSDEHGAVNSMIGEGRPFAEIEDYINALRLPSEQLGALWLLAWTEATDPLTRSQLIAETIVALGATAQITT